MKNKKAHFFYIIMFILFFVCNWMMDITFNFRNGATNGLWSINKEYLILFNHIFWYISIAIFVVFATTLYYKVNHNG